MVVKGHRRSNSFSGIRHRHSLESAYLNGSVHLNGSGNTSASTPPVTSPKKHDGYFPVIDLDQVLEHQFEYEKWLQKNHKSNAHLDSRPPAHSQESNIRERSKGTKDGAILKVSLKEALDSGPPRCYEFPESSKKLLDMYHTRQD